MNSCMIERERERERETEVDRYITRVRAQANNCDYDYDYEYDSDSDYDCEGWRASRKKGEGGDETRREHGRVGQAGGWAADRETSGVTDRQT